MSRDVGEGVEDKRARVGKVPWGRLLERALLWLVGTVRGGGAGGSFYRPPLHVRPFPFLLLGAAPRPLSCQSPKRVASTHRFSTPESYTPLVRRPNLAPNLPQTCRFSCLGPVRKRVFLPVRGTGPFPPPF